MNWQPFKREYQHKSPGGFFVLEGVACRGLAVCRRPYGAKAYEVAHVETGAGIVTSFRSKSRAVSFAELLLKTGKWEGMTPKQIVVSNRAAVHRAVKRFHARLPRGPKYPI